MIMSESGVSIEPEGSLPKEESRAEIPSQDSKPDTSNSTSNDTTAVEHKTTRTSMVLERKKRLQPVESGAFVEMNKLKDYDIIEKLGQGTFGVVQKARSKKSGKLVAIKQLINHSAKEGFPITAMREITILKKLNHDNILKISEMIFEEPKVASSADLITHRGCFYTVSPYMSSDLVGLLENPAVHLELSYIKCFLQQLLRGIQYIHDNKFLHRDIKAANILIDASGVLKIADFGLARTYHGSVPKLGLGPGGGERSYTGLVVTRWYRPPEILLGERQYTTAVDLWGIGCVFGELFTHKPILLGKSDIHQIQLVFGLVGPPTDWTHAAVLPNNSGFNIGLACKRTLESRFQDVLPPDGIDLLSGLLTLDPYKRMNALDALNHEFFKNSPLPVKPHELPRFEECHEIDKDRFKKLKERANGHRETPPNSYSQRPQNTYQNQSKPAAKSTFVPAGPSNYNARKNTSSYVPNQKTNLTSSYVPAQNKPSYAQASSYVPSQNQASTYVPGQSTVSSYSSRNDPHDQASQREEERRGYESSRERATSGIRRTSPESVRVKPAGHLPKKPASYEEEHEERPRPKPKPAPSSGIFMKRSMPPARPVKRIKTLKNEFKEGNESELSDVDGDFKKEEEEKLNDFLDYEGFQKDSEYRKMSNERVKYTQGQKKKSVGMNY